MPARTRALLAALGIPVWGARGANVQRVPIRPVWQGQHGREIAAQPVVDQAVMPVRSAVASVVVATPPTRPALVAPAVEDGAVVIAKAPVVERVPPRTSRQPFVDMDQAPPLEATPRLRFAVQARVIGRWIVMVPDDALTDDAARRLWDNIGIAMQAKTVQHFAWPLAEGARWQQMDGAAAGLAGFLFRLGPMHRVGLMGDLPDVAIPDRVERLPALADLLADPLQKRSLWQLLSLPALTQHTL